MKPTNDILKLIKKLRIKASSELDRRVHNDISRAIAEPDSAVVRPNVWRYIARGGVVKLAVAAAIIIAFGIGFVIGHRSKLTHTVVYSFDVTGYATAVSVYPTTPKGEDSFWRQKALAATQPRPYVQSRFTETDLMNVYKQYLKEKNYD
jgi:hypothetical protein